MIRVAIRRIMISIVMLSVTILNADMLSVLSVGMLIVMAPLLFQFLSIRQAKNLENHGQTIFFP
jgi:hypothetical protein